MKAFIEIEVEVNYDFKKGYPQTREEPGMDDSIEVTEVFIGKTNIANELSDDEIGKIEEQIMEDLADRQRAAEEDRAEALCELHREESGL